MSVVELLLVKVILFHDMVILLHSMMVGSWILIKMVCLAMVIVLLIWLVVTTFSFGRGSTETLLCDNVL